MAHWDDNRPAPEIGWSKAPGSGQNKKHQNTQAALKGQLDSVAKEKRPGKATDWKIDEETENFRHAEVGHDFKMALMKARTAKGLKQAELAQRINCPAKVIQEYENGKAIPDGQVINKLNRILGVTLPKVKKPKKAKD